MSIRESFNYGPLGLLTMSIIVIIGNIVVTYLLVQLQTWIRG